MMHSTDITSCALISSPLWLQSVNPYVQFVGVGIGILWIAVQLYYKIRNESFKKRP